MFASVAPNGPMPQRSNKAGEAVAVVHNGTPGNDGRGHIFMLIMATCGEIRAGNGGGGGGAGWYRRVPGGSGGRGGF